MKDLSRITVVTVMLMVLLTNPVLLAWGNPPPGRWEKVAQLKPGERITVYSKDGMKLEYDFAMLDDDYLHCANQYSGPAQIELATINKIVVSKTGKYAKHGALWGAIGGAAVIEGMAAYYGDVSHTLDYILVGLVGAALGAGGGFLAGAALGAPGETVYISKDLAMKEANK